MKDINDVFEENPEEVTQIELDEVKVNSSGTDLDIASDYVLAREKVITSIIRSSQVLDTATVEALTAPSPRVLEAFSAISKNLNDSTKNLIELHEKFRQVEKEETQTQNEKGVSEATVKTTLSSLLQEISKEKTIN